MPNKQGKRDYLVEISVPFDALGMHATKINFVAIVPLVGKLLNQATGLMLLFWSFGAWDMFTQHV